MGGEQVSGGRRQVAAEGAVSMAVPVAAPASAALQTNATLSSPAHQVTKSSMFRVTKKAGSVTAGAGRGPAGRREGEWA